MQPSFSYQCIGLYVTALLDRGYQSEMKAPTDPCMGPSIFHIYPCVEKSEVFFSGPAGRAAMPVHTGLRGASHPCGRFFSAQKVQGCVSSYVRHGIFNPKLMSETVK